MADQDFPIRGPGPDMAGRSLVVGRFPLGEPDFRGKRAGFWRLTVAADPAAVPPTGDAPHPPPPPLGDPATAWALGDGPGRTTHVSAPEGIPGGGSAGYFVLLRDGAGGFTAWPVDAWHTFRPRRRHAIPSLEEAEEAMERRARGLQPLPHSRLAAMVGRAVEDDRRAGRAGPDEGGGGGEDEDAGDDGDDDDRPGRRTAGRAGGSRPASRPAPPTTAAAVGAVAADRPAGAEDWEHEGDAADDDLDMGDEDDGGGGGDGGGALGGLGGLGGRRRRPGGRASPGSPLSPSEDDDDGDDEFGRPRLTGAGAELKRILASTGLEETDSDDEGGRPPSRAARAAAARPPSAGPSARSGGRSASPAGSTDDDGGGGDGDDDDDEDLDVMAAAYKPGVMARLASGPAGPPPDQAPPRPPSRTVSPPSSSGGGGAGGAGGTKRKATTPGGEAKKAKAAAPAPGGQGPPTDAEVAAALREKGPMPSSAFTALFKARLAAGGPDWKKEFMAAVKRVARLEERPPGSGVKVIVLRE